MKKLLLLLMLSLVSFVGYAASDSNKIVGSWQWSNAPVDYPIFIEFKSNGNMYIHKMKPTGLDTDNYKWNLDDRTIYYTRPAADEKVVLTMEIIRNDDTTLILRDTEGDMWLTKNQ